MGFTAPRTVVGVVGVAAALVAATAVQADATTQTDLRLRSAVVDRCLSASAYAPYTYACSGGSNQLWTANGDLRNVGTGKCLDADGANVYVMDCNGGGNQQWAFYPNGMVQNLSSGRCLASASAVYNVSTLSCDPADAYQIWTF